MLRLNLIIVLMFVVVAVLNVEPKRKERKARVDSDISWTINPTLPGSTRVNPEFAREAWNLFQRNDERDRIERSRKKRLRKLRAGTFFSREAIGPPGPRGPPGLPGLKGENMTKEEIFEEFRTMIRGMTAKKHNISDDPKCPELCNSSLEGNETGPIVKNPLFEKSPDLLIPKMITAFMWELKDYITIPKKSFVELDAYVQSLRSGGFERGVENSKAATGRFVIPRTGYYTFYVRTHLQLPDAENGGTAIGTGNELSVLLCIEALCRENLNLETISGFGPGHKMTVFVSGMLFLEIRQYVSVFIDNNSRNPVHVIEGSQFSGYLDIEDTCGLPGSNDQCMLYAYSL